MGAVQVVTAAGLSGAVLASRSRTATALSGVALVAASALTMFGIFMAGKASARDPAYTVGPQRERLAAAEASAAGVTPADRTGPARSG